METITLEIFYLFDDTVYLAFTSHLGYPVALLYVNYGYRPIYRKKSF
jgi:hypothetical protein